MAKAAGIDAGEYEVKVVELDGSYRKPRLSKVFVEPVGQDTAKAGDEEHARREAEAIAGALEGGAIAKDSLAMSFPCREAVLRVLSVPFVGEDQIRKVIKFEAESAIHSHNVDDMIVDFHMLSEAGTETKVLIAAVPKAPLRATLSALGRVGVEPVSVDLDTMALLNCAEWCGAFEAPSRTEGEDGVEGEGSDLPAVAATSQLILDLGARSTRVLVVANGALVDMRSLRTGSDAIAEEIAAKAGVDLREAREAAWNSLSTGDDYWVEIQEEEAAHVEEDSDGAALPAQRSTEATPIVHGDVAAARDRYLARLRLELVRFLASVGSAGGIGGVWITGGASEIPGVVGLLQDVFGETPRQLDVLGQLSHKLSPEEVADLGPRLAVAVGLALHGLGGPKGFNLRQEDLAYTKGFDRVKFPLAVACVLAVFLVLVYAVGRYKELAGLEQQYGSVYDITPKKGRRGTSRDEVKFFGYVGSLVNPPNGWFAMATHYDEREYDKLIDKLVDLPVFNRLGAIKSNIESHFRNLQKESGYYPDLRLGSALGAVCELSDLLVELEPQLGRYLLTELEVKLPYQEKNRYLRFKVVMRSDNKSDFRTKGDQILLEAIKRKCESPTSAFAALNKETSEKEVFPDDAGGQGSYLLQVRIDLRAEEHYPVFPTSTP